MEITVTPKELFYLGGIMQAKYIDYAYIAALDDIRENTDISSREAVAELGKAGLVTEDFSGEIEIDPDAASLLKPIFYGEKESSLDICYLGDEKRVDIYKFHFLDDKITMVTGTHHKLSIKQIDALFFDSLVSGLLPDGYEPDTGAVISEIGDRKAGRFIVAKLAEINVRSVVRPYIDIDGVIYYETDGGELVPADKDGFVNEVTTVLRGDNNGI